MDEKAFVSDQELPAAKEVKDQHRQRFFLQGLCAMHVILLAGGAGALLMGSYMIGMMEARGSAFDACLYPLGGGLVVSGGNFPQKLNSGKQCDSVRRKYLVKQYDDDVADAISTTWDFLDGYKDKPDKSQVAVFDIDETSLSNRAEWLGTMGVEIQHEGRPGGTIQNRSAEAFLPRHLRHSAAQGGSGAPQESAPALEPTLQIYKELYRRGFSVTFITGRTNSGGAHEATAENLLQAGYGRPCSEGATQDASTSSVQAVAAQELPLQRAKTRIANRKLLQESAAGTRSAQDKAAGNHEEEPCYVELGMREEGDTRLASVYKPEKRGKLEERGYTILAIFGDQWSDLSGPSAGKASFLLPNPFYYLL